VGILWTITAKDLRQRVRDRSVLLLAFVVPIGLAVLFDLLFGGLAEGSLGDIDLAVVDLDGGEVGAAFTDAYLPQVVGFLEDDGTTVRIEEPPSADEARQGVEDGTHDAAIVLPPDLTSDLAAADPVQIEVVTHADRQIVGDVATSFADRFAQQARGQLGARVLAERLQLPPDEADAFARGVGTVQGRIGLDTTAARGQQLDPSTYLAAGMAVFFLFFTVQFGVLGYLQERRDGTLSRLLAAPIARWQVLGAKTLTSLVVGTVSVATLMLVSVPLLGASWGDPLGVAGLVVAAVVAATSLVAAVAGIARTAEQANVWQSILAIVLGMLGGSFFQLEGGPGWLSSLSLLTPHAWFLRGLGTLADPAAGLADVLVPIGAMLSFAAVVLGLAGLLSRREVAT
jgi:ABC-2 type transport system permease protein